MGRVISAFAQFFDGSGDPLALGWLRFLESNSNNTDKDTYSDNNLSIANSNPLQLDSEGRCPSVFGQGSYRVILFEYDPDDESNPGQQIQVFDPVNPIGDSAAGSGGTFDIWSSSVTYLVGALVTHNSKYYRSIQNNNLNNNPAVDASYWEELQFTSVWNQYVPYDEGVMVRYADSIYFSKESINLNNIPSQTPDKWIRCDTEFVDSEEVTINTTLTHADIYKLWIWGSTAIADGEFTLPDMSTIDDSVEFIFYNNNSSYTLTIIPGALESVWLESDIVLKYGSFVTLIYDPTLTKWMIKGNHGPSLGGQDIGTSANKIGTIHVSTIGNSIDVTGHITPETTLTYDLGSVSKIWNNIHGNTINVSANINVAASGSVNFNSVSGMYDSSGDLTIKGNVYLYLQTATVNKWRIGSDGHIIPISPYDLGASANKINNIHTVSLTMYGDILPATKTFYKIGSEALPFSTMYLQSGIYCDYESGVSSAFLGKNGANLQLQNYESAGYLTEITLNGTTGVISFAIKSDGSKTVTLNNATQTGSVSTTQSGYIEVIIGSSPTYTRKIRLWT